MTDTATAKEVERVLTTSDLADENELDENEQHVAAWIKGMHDSEIARLTQAGAKAVPLKVKNMAIVREDAGVVLNRVEVDTRFSMDRIEQILVAEETTSVPRKPHFVYVNVLLLPKASTIALVMPYVYDTRVAGNTLTQWVFLNNNMERSHHVIG
ncbi:hypothetical protein DYB28_001259 [Aphanomyces astaci]|uniref:Uncharacterized protein n=1 Tax=Aphanomyces astaci TaxID=112090 RepID=A0A397DY82_APHAT|nr:hypothetical protein DYB36_001788 [Aphanomyces astaci]RHY69656.1 hypothetical protein DYB30_006714 [Aphanomyces astaci]RHY72743.1 hypothetical protein DYB38_012851 [Aphanomyces astaci]RHY75328.1 hypothetical protein DYB34_014003 [Aphanomyces astaci]RHZ00960.1 hypothetical protein DYB31_003674 [Aphanomyces astaci]